MLALKVNKWLQISIIVSVEEAITNSMLGVSMPLSTMIRSLYY